MKITALNSELAAAGVPTDYVHLGRTLSPLEALLKGSFSAKPYADILIKYVSDVEVENNDKEFIARALTEKGLSVATRSLLDLFDDPTMTQLQLWAVGNALCVIDDKSTYKKIIQLVKRTELGIARQMLLGTLANSKDEEAYNVLIDCLNDANLKGHAIEALGRFGNTDAIEILDEIEVEKGKFEFKATQTALRRLQRKRASE
ncbi:MAG: HEAT repeat domain-containing protein [Bacteroidota bacterium]